ncbi:MAG: hypothetical protein ACWA5P_11700 [bacterium]
MIKINFIHCKIMLLLLLLNMGVAFGQKESPAYKYYQRCENTLNTIEDLIVKNQPESQYLSYFKRVENYLTAGKSKDVNFDFSHIEARLEALKRGEISPTAGLLEENLLKITKYRSWISNLSNRANINKLNSSDFSIKDLDITIAYFKNATTTNSSEINRVNEGLRKVNDIEIIRQQLDKALEKQGVLKQLNQYQTLVQNSTTKNEIEQYAELGLNIINALKQLGHTQKLMAYETEFNNQLSNASLSVESRKKKLFDKFHNAKLTKLPEAAESNPSLENKYKALLQPIAAHPIKKVILMSPRFGVNKDAIGRPIDKSKTIAVVEKNGNGKCFVQYFYIIKKYTNGNFGPDRGEHMEGNGSRTRDISCELAKLN